MSETTERAHLGSTVSAINTAITVLTLTRRQMAEGQTAYPIEPWLERLGDLKQEIEEFLQ